MFKKHAKWFISRVSRDRLDSSAAHSSFFLIIAFLPFMALLLTIMQRVHFSDGVSLIESAVNLLPENVAETVLGIMPNPLETTGVLPVSIIMAAWSSSMSMVAVIKGLDQIYEVKETRNYFRLRLTGFVYVLLLVVVIIITAALLVFGSTIYDFLLQHSPPFFATLLMKFKSVVGFVILFALFLLMYSFLPRRRVKFLHNLIGAAVAAAGWVLFSFFFSLFVENFASFSIYGSLATLVILMYWLFFCMYILFIGAEVSMWLETSTIKEDWKHRKKKKAREKARKEREKQAQTGAGRPDGKDS